MLKNFDNENISSLADNQGQLSDRQPNVSEREKYKQMAVKDINTIQNLVQSGVMTQEQGQNLMNFVTQKAFEKYTTVNAPQQSTQIDKMVGKTAQNTVMPEFFNQNGRIDVYDYLKNSALDFDGDELSKISSLIEKIENNAVQRYLEKQKHEKALNNENESAKLRLRANAQNNTSDGLKNLVFTREQIGKMSGAEFARNEKTIMDQLRKGLIK